MKKVSLLIILTILSCGRSPKENNNQKVVNSDSSQIQIDTIKSERPVNNLDDNEEFISANLFKNWKGNYVLENDYSDGWERESILHSELSFFKA